MTIFHVKLNMLILKFFFALMILSRHKVEEGFEKIGVAMFRLFEIYGLQDCGPIFQKEVTMR